MTIEVIIYFAFRFYGSVLSSEIIKHIVVCNKRIEGRN